MTLKTHRVFGPPGTGKTTYLASQIKRAVDLVGPSKLVISSFSRAAAEELTSRDNVSVDKECIGTTHSLCYRLFDAPELAEGHADEWNETHPSFRVATKTPAILIDQPELESTAAQDPLVMYNLLRARGKATCEMLLDAEKRHRASAVSGKRLIEFIAKWEDWKAANGYFDFTDLLVMALDDFKELPHKPTVGFFDEVQDYNPLMMELIQEWSSHTDHSILVGDDDQTIYSFMGATPDAFIGGDSEDDIVLSKSYRLPEAIRAWSEDWIRQIKNRKEKEFAPRCEGGEVLDLYKKPTMNYRNAPKIVDMIESDIVEGKSVMILGSCSYMLLPVIKVMKERGVPFCNHYRPSNGSWNPLPKGSEKRVPTWKRLQAFMSWYLEDKEEWSYDDFYRWREHVSTKTPGLVNGCLKRDYFGIDTRTSIPIGEIFDGANERPPFNGDVDAALAWLEGALPSSKRKAYEYAGRVIRAGYGGTLEGPFVTVGTIHSVKGGEADKVYLIPDISPSGTQGMNKPSSEGRDAIIRLFYVGATRARESLTLLAPVNATCAVRWKH